MKKKTNKKSAGYQSKIGLTKDTNVRTRSFIRSTRTDRLDRLVARLHEKLLSLCSSIGQTHSQAGFADLKNMPSIIWRCEHEHV